MINQMIIKKFLIILISKFLLFFSFNALSQDFIDDASNYTVRFRVLVDHPFVEDTNDDDIIRSWVGAGFVVDKPSGLIVTNAHVSGVGNTFIKIAFKGERFIKSELIYKIVVILTACKSLHHVFDFMIS